jgi:hypothetical protein
MGGSPVSDTTFRVETALPVMKASLFPSGEKFQLYPPTVPGIGSAVKRFRGRLHS